MVWLNEHQETRKKTVVQRVKELTHWRPYKIFEHRCGFLNLKIRENTLQKVGEEKNYRQSRRELQKEMH